MGSMDKQLTSLVHGSENNKARSVSPGRLPAQPWCLPKGDGRSCASLVLDNSLIV